MTELELAQALGCKFSGKPNEKFIIRAYDFVQAIYERIFKLPKTKFDNLYGSELKVVTKYYNGYFCGKETADGIFFRSKSKNFSICIFQDTIEVNSDLVYGGGRIPIPWKDR